MEALLTSKGMTQRELAARLGVSEVTASRWMADGANRRNPSISTLQKIADLLETTLTTFWESKKHLKIPAIRWTWEQSLQEPPSLPPLSSASLPLQRPWESSPKRTRTRFRTF
ncbi:MAG: helix-turn-helix transcriptional regulator [Spirochaetaceae bacterium]|nr:helix-turn-helix transcriptional regulator [Spirochaetaceae bacterium]